MNRENFYYLEGMLNELNWRADTNNADVEIMQAITTCEHYVHEVGHDLADVEFEKFSKPIFESAVYSLIEYVKLKTDSGYSKDMEEVNDQAVYILFSMDSWNCGPIICW